MSGPAPGPGEDCGLVTIAAGRHDHLRGQRRALARSHHLPAVHVVVSMGDQALSRELAGAPIGAAATDLIELPPAEELPLAAARNAGVAHCAALRLRWVILLDVDCLPAPRLVADYRAALVSLGRLPAACRGEATAYRPVADGAPAVVTGRVRYLPPAGRDGYDLSALASLGRDHPARQVPPRGRLAPADPRLFWSLSAALTLADWERIGGFEEAYVGYGGEDTDFGQRLAAVGGTLWWSGEAQAWHQHHDDAGPPLRHVASIVRNANLFADRWGFTPMEGWLEDFARRGLARRVGDRWRVVPLPLRTCSSSGGGPADPGASSAPRGHRR